MNKRFATLPAVQPGLIGPIPDLHAKRVVGEMVEFLEAVSATYNQKLTAAMMRPVGGNPKAQQRWADRVNRATTPVLVDFATTWGKRAKFQMILSIWTPDRWNGATVWTFFLYSDGPGTEKRKNGPLWRFSQHALIRLVQRSGATDAVRLMLAMRAVAPAVGDGMANARLKPGDGQILHLKFNGGIAVVDWPGDSDVAVVKTVLGPEMALPGLGGR
jgi:hypothetical protein